MRAEPRPKINLNIKKTQLTESFLHTFGFLTKELLKYTFGDAAIPVKIKEEEAVEASGPNIKIVGTAGQVDTFIEALKQEKEYMKKFLDLGLNDPETLSSRHELHRAVEAFEKETGIRWPFTS